MEIKPVNTYILVKEEEQQEKTSGGLYMPQTVDAKDILKSGTVVDVSQKVIDEKCSFIKEGDTIYYNKHAVTKIPEYEGYVLVRFEDVYGISK